MNVRLVGLLILTSTLIIWGLKGVMPDWYINSHSSASNVETSQTVICLAQNAALPAPVVQLQQLLSLEKASPPPNWGSDSDVVEEGGSERLIALQARLEHLKIVPSH
ncbi:hypothetical protein V4V48_003075 [Vibrio mimicus]